MFDDAREPDDNDYIDDEDDDDKDANVKSTTNYGINIAYGNENDAMLS